MDYIVSVVNLSGEFVWNWGLLNIMNSFIIFEFDLIKMKSNWDSFFFESIFRGKSICFIIRMNNKICFKMVIYVFGLR